MKDKSEIAGYGDVRGRRPPLPPPVCEVEVGGGNLM